MLTQLLDCPIESGNDSGQVSPALLLNNLIGAVPWYLNHRKFETVLFRVSPYNTSTGLQVNIDIPGYRPVKITRGIYSKRTFGRHEEQEIVWRRRAQGPEEKGPDRNDSPCTDNGRFTGHSNTAFAKYPVMTHVQSEVFFPSNSQITLNIDSSIEAAVCLFDCGLYQEVFHPQ